MGETKEKRVTVVQVRCDQSVDQDCSGGRIEGWAEVSEVRFIRYISLVLGWGFFCPQNCLYSRTRRLLLHPGSGRGGSRLSRDTQTSLSPDTTFSSSGGSPRRSQASRET
ncbi:hypothetical protein ATANTOWER_017472 [Ataeniobius toweri]|uniref:Uncharacterized protein n=1 Tax=Ataeniobius toweri TaxID=208326 RepID=A0ABU7CBH3_9TELE|nr:hypothetical protein [Ataeniobius toweri]